MDRLLRASQTGEIRESHEEAPMILSDDAIIEITSAEYVADYKLRLWFSDGKQRVVDFGPFLRRSLNPMIRAYLDLEKFKQFSVEDGDLQWNDYDLCFPIADLYEGKI